MTQRNDLPTTIPAYLAQLRRALAGADAAMIQDALYDAEEYLRSEMAAQPGRSEAEVIASVAGSYGAPEEVADIYRETEATVQAALRSPGARVASPPRVDMAAGAATVGAAGASPPPPVPAGRSPLQRLFGVFVDPQTWGALFYMLLALATGTLYFTWTVAGLGVTLGTMVLIIGLPLFVLFIGASRVLALVEGRVVETLLGERMPRRAPYSQRELPLLERIKGMFTDMRTWSTFVYFLLMLPLGILYFTVAVTLLTMALTFMASPVLALLGVPMTGMHLFGMSVGNAPWTWPLLVLVGFALLVLLLHVARGLGRLHGRLAKLMLVRNAGLD